MGYDAFLLLSFGGPEGPDDVLPFLHNVTRGRDVPDERLAAVAEHYMHFGGVSPINGQCRSLLAALGGQFAAVGIDLPIYWGNRNWHPYLPDTLARMRDDGVRSALAFVTSAYGGYSSCRQYLEDIDHARALLGDGAPAVDKIRQFHDHPGWIAAHAEAVTAALSRLPEAGRLAAEHRATTRLVFTAHSVPESAAASAGPGGGDRRYEAELREACALVAAAAAPDLSWDLAWQSRSGPPSVPWLAPDINDHLRSIAAQGVTRVVVSPIGFVSDHLEVVWDLDREAAATADHLGLGFVRAATPGTHPAFVAAVADLVRERIEGLAPRKLGTVPCWDACPAACCTPRPRPVPPG